VSDAQGPTHEPAPVQIDAAPPVPAPVRIGGYSAPLTDDWSLSAAFGVVILNLVLNALLALLMWSEWLTLPSSGAARSLALGALLFVPYAVTLTVVWVMLRREGRTWSEGVGLRGWYLWAGLGVSCAVALGGRVVAIWWAGALVGLGLEPPASLDATSLFPEDPLGIAMLVIIAVVVAPIVEETVYRGMLFPSLRERFGRRWGVVLSSVVFGVAHLSFVWLLVPTAFIGAMLALLFEWTRSLRAPIVAHAVFNGSALAIAYGLSAAGVG
jgi:membrane protease YdiL (CAAX protease family)